MLKYIFLLFSGSLLSSGLTFLTQTLLAKNLSPAQFGTFTSTLSLVMILSPIIGMGVDTYLLKYRVKNELGIKRYIGKALIYAFLSSFISFIIFLFIIDINTYQPLFVVILLSQFGINFCVALYQIRGKYHYVAAWLSIQSCIRFIGVGIFTISSIQNVNYYYILYSSIGIIMLLISLLIITREYNSYDKRYSELKLKELITKSVPFGIGTFCHLVYFQSDIVLLNELSSSENAGIYSIAFTMISITYLLPASIYQKYLVPKIHILSEKKSNELELIFKKGNGAMFIIGSIVAILILLLSPTLVEILFGKQYIESVVYIKYLSVCIILRYMSSNLGVFLLTDDLVNKKNKFMLITAIFNVLLNLVLIPKLGILGATISTLASEFILYMLFLYGVKKYKFGDDTFNNFFGFKIYWVKYVK